MRPMIAHRPRRPHYLDAFAQPRPYGPNPVWREVWRLSKPARDVIFDVCQRRNVFVWEVLSPAKRRPVAHARWEIWTELRKRGWSTIIIGTRTGIFDHSTVVRGIQAARERAEHVAM